MINTVIILAGGLGTRLKSVLPETPKCLAPIQNYPFLGILINYLCNQGIENFVFAVGYRNQMVIDFLEMEFPTLKISYSIETELLGTGGAIKLALSKVNSENVLIVNGDTFYNNDLQQFSKFHYSSKSDFSIALTKIRNNERYGSVELDGMNRIIDFKEKNIGISDGLISSGHYIFNKAQFLRLNPQNNFSVETDFFQNPNINKYIFGFERTAGFIDIGIPEDYQLAQTFFK